MPVFNCTTHCYISHINTFLAMRKTSHHHPLSSSLDSFATVFLKSTRSQLLRKAALHSTEEGDSAHQDEDSRQEGCERREDVEAIEDHVHCGREGVDAKEAVDCNTEPEPTGDKKKTKKKNVTFSDCITIEVFSFEAPSCSADDDDDDDYSEATFDDCDVFDLIFCVACV